MIKTCRWLFFPFLAIMAIVVVVFIIVLPFLLASDQDQSLSLGLSTVIQGRVIDSANTPISGARVRIVGAQEYTTTNKEGFFFLGYQGDASELLIAAGKKGYYNDGLLVERGRAIIMLERIPPSNGKGYSFVDPESRGMGMMAMMRMNCASCHQRIYDEWKNSTMARTTHNRWVLNLYNGTDAEGKRGVSPGYKLDFPERKGNCADCHTPSAALDAPGQTDLNMVLQQGGVNAKGVHCDFCHKIQDVKVSNQPGIQSVTMNRLSPVGMMMMRPVFAFGPYEDVISIPMISSYNPLFEKSEFCSSCHQDAVRLPKGKRWDYLQVYPKAKDYELYENGTVIPAQWTYQEWLEWQSNLPPGDPDKGRQCQDCHMNWTEETLPYDEYIVDGMAKRMMGVRREAQRIHPHHFEGASESRLKGAVYMWVDTDILENELIVSVDITNVNAGHRLPTGSSFRNIILLVSAEDTTGTPLKFLKGSRVPDWGGIGSSYTYGNYAGHPGKGFAKILEDAEGNQPVQDWQAVRVASDNRIKPKETDKSVYRFELPPNNSGGIVAIKLIYRRAFKPLADAKIWKLEDIVMKEREISF